MTRHVSLIFMVCLTLQTAFAIEPNDAGNGGYGVICKKPGGKLQVQLLDFFEAKFRKLLYSLGTNNSVQDKVGVALKRLSRLDEKRAKRYQERASKFMVNANFFPNVTLQGKIDFVTGIIETGCEIGLIAIQKKPRFEEDKLFTISSDYWNAMDDDHKAGLILHEIIYQDALQAGQQDSVGTRYFVGTIASEKIEKLNRRAYFDLLDKVGFQTQGIGGYVSSSPLWLVDPVSFTMTANSGAGFDISSSFSLGKKATFSVPDALKFLEVSSDGWIRLTPSTQDIGNFSFPLIAEVGGKQYPVPFELHVLPTQITVNNDYRWQAVVDEPFMAQIDLDGGETTGGVIPNWISVSRTGKVFGTPRKGDIGTKVLTVGIKKGQDEKQVHAVIEVLAAGFAVPGQFEVHKPVKWKSSPTDLGTIQANAPYTLDLKTLVFRKEGEKLTFSAANLPSWMRLNSDGLLTGEPFRQDSGKYSNILLYVIDDGNVAQSVPAFCEVK